MVVAMPLPTNAFASSANVLRGGGALLFSSLSKCSHPLQIYRHRRPLQPIRSSTASLPLFSIGKANETSARSRRSSSRHWLPSFCTASTSDASAAEAVTVATGDDGDADVDDEKKERMIKEAAEMLDIRVGRILRAWRHEEADSLYVEEVDVGEPEPRIICSGLVNYIPLQHLQVFSHFSLHFFLLSWTSRLMGVFTWNEKKRKLGLYLAKRKKDLNNFL